MMGTVEVQTRDAAKRVEGDVMVEYGNANCTSFLCFLQVQL